MKARIFFAVAAVTMAFHVKASDLSVGEFRVKSPVGWSVHHATNGYDATGPGEAVMRIRVYLIAGGTSDPAGKKAAKNVRDATVEAVGETVRRNRLVEQLPLRIKQLRAGSLEESLHTTPDARGYLALYILEGERSVVVATIEGSATQVKQIVPIRQSFVAALGGEASSK